MPGVVVLRLCTTCRQTDWQALRDAVAAAGLPVRILEQACMNGCAEPVSMALQGEGRATYFFTGIDPVGDAADVVATLRAYLEAEAGWIEDARGCGRLRFCLKGRVPTLSSR